MFFKEIFLDFSHGLDAKILSKDMWQHVAYLILAKALEGRIKV